MQHSKITCRYKMIAAMELGFMVIAVIYAKFQLVYTLYISNRLIDIFAPKLVDNSLYISPIMNYIGTVLLVVPYIIVAFRNLYNRKVYNNKLIIVFSAIYSVFLLFAAIKFFINATFLDGLLNLLMVVYLVVLIVLSANQISSEKCMFDFRI